MVEESILHIRESIALARKQEAEGHALEKYLESKLPVLHKNICLPDDNASQVLIDFVTRYIEHVPDFLEALKDLTESAGIYNFIKQFFDIVEGYFVEPPELVVDEHMGLHALIDEAYIAHRLMEEVNDRVMLLSGLPLTPMDTTISNIIVHDILGEDFANELDLAVHYSIESLFNPKAFNQNPDFSQYISRHKEKGWGQDLEKWPCLAGDSSISLDLEKAIKPMMH